MTVKATEIFTPGSFPTRTYVERAGAGLESMLRDALDTPGQVVSLVGPSKSGKTVLVERVVGRDELITITGAGIRTADDLWTRVLDWMGAPMSMGTESSTSVAIAAEAGVSTTASFFGLLGTEGDVRGSVDGSRAVERARSFERRGLTQVVEEIANSDFVVLVDDFHYMPRDTQTEVAKSVKEAVRLGVKVCTAAVRHRGDDLVRANPELRGRVRAIDLQYWSDDDLMSIGTSGFAELNIEIDHNLLEKLVSESAGSPQLMQLLCLNACFVLGYRHAQDNLISIRASTDQVNAIFDQASASTDFRSLVDVLDAGPKTRGTERIFYDFTDGSRGDVYRCVLKAVAADPPRQSCSYDDLVKRTARVCSSSGPVGSSVTGTCVHMAKLALDKFPNERAIDWDEQKQVLDIPDPYLLFYLRWSGRLSEID